MEMLVGVYDLCDRALRDHTNSDRSRSDGLEVSKMTGDAPSH